MKQFSIPQLALLHLLSDGYCHSSKIIGKKLNISPTAVGKNIRLLEELGLTIQRIPLQGYQLIHPMKPLDEQLIREQLNNKFFDKAFNFHLFAEIGSTNQFLKELIDDTPLTLCCAEKQTKGRGRFGRQWFSPFGENIYFSSRWLLNCSLSHLSGLSLVVGLAILASLRDNHFDQNVGIKWPNDVMWGAKKLSGILIEINTETNGCAKLIIGIGINVNTATHLQPLMDKPWCSLYEIKRTYSDRNNLLANLIFHLTQYLDKFLKSGFVAFTDEWKKFDYLEGQFITVSQPKGLISGQACGVNKLGQLCLRDNNNLVHYLSSGDTSLCSDIQFS